MIAAYVRVSSKAQDLATQRDAITRACEARGLSVDVWYAEQASTRKELPELRRLRKDAGGGRFSRVFVFRLDRLSRGTICEMLNLLQEFKGAGCQVVSVADGLPLDGPFGEFIVSAIALCAGMEREAIQNRVASARARVEAAGGSWGRPSVLDAAKRERITNMKRKGYSVRKVAKMVKAPTSTVFAFMKTLPGAPSAKLETAGDHPNGSGAKGRGAKPSNATSKRAAVPASNGRVSKARRSA